jgi:hypothetical protein
MTANKLNLLVDILERRGEDRQLEAATMLRQQQAELDAFKLNYYNTGYSLQLRDKDETIKQQQAEIEALKKELALQRLSDIGQEIEDTECQYCKQGCFRCDARKALTIEEITEVSKEIFKGYKNFYHYQINFARAILKKASEK